MVNDIKETAKKRMDGVIDQLNTNLSSVRTGRANAMILDRVKAEYYGTLTPVNQMAAIKTPDAHTLVIEPWDKSSLGAIEAAIMNANLGVNPNNDGQVIRLPFPSLTEERRKELTKMARKSAEGAKVAVRSIRRDAVEQIKKLKKDSLITEDEQRKAEDDAQKITDKAIKDIDSICAAKEKEIMEV